MNIYEYNALLEAVKNELVPYKLGESKQNTALTKKIVDEYHVRGYMRISESVQAIFDSAFMMQSRLKGLFIPQSVSIISVNAFFRNTSLKFFAVHPENPYFSSEDGILYNKPHTRLLFYPIGKINDSFTVPDNVERISETAFFDAHLKCITLSASIKENTFNPIALQRIIGLEYISVSPKNEQLCSVDGILFNKDMTRLIMYPAKKSGSEYVVPQSVKHISTMAFCDCKKLKRISLPYGLESIGEQAFMNCSSLEKLELPETLELIKESCFSGCSALKTITLPPKIRVIPKAAFASCKSLISVDMPDSVKIIGKDAFNSCSLLVGICFPSELQYIGEYAFENCIKLETLDIPQSLTKMGAGAFVGCLALKTVRLPDKMEIIANRLFSDCIALQEVYLPSDFKQLLDDAFERCEKIKIIHINGVTITADTKNYFDIKAFRIQTLINKINIRDINYFQLLMRSGASYLECDEYIKNNADRLIRYCIKKNEVTALKYILSRGQLLEYEQLIELVELSIEKAQVHHVVEPQILLIKHKDKYFPNHSAADDLYI